MSYDYIIDNGCSGYTHVCNWSWENDNADMNVTEDDFSPSMDDNFFGVIFASVLIPILCSVFIILIFNGETDQCIKKIILFNSLHYILGGAYLISYYFTTSTNICEFNYHCDVVDDNLINSKLYYKLINEECSNSPLDIYANYYDNDNTCENSEYGCCMYDFTCDFAVKKEYNSSDLYNHYQHTGYPAGYSQLHLRKEDEGGSNCPNIETILLKDSLIHNKKVINYFIIVNILYIIFVLLYVLCARRSKKEGFVPVDDLEKGPSVLRGSA